MKKFLSITLSVFTLGAVTLGFWPPLIPKPVIPHIEAQASEVTTIKTYEEKLGELSEKELDKRIDAIFEKAGTDTINIYEEAEGKQSLTTPQAIFSLSGDYITCTNRENGIIYRCNYRTSYVGYEYNNQQACGCIQLMLNRISGANLKVDAIFGPRTYNAIMNFQRSQHISEDGIAGPDTFRVAVLCLFGQAV